MYLVLRTETPAAAVLLNLRLDQIDNSPGNCMEILNYSTANKRGGAPGVARIKY